ncbi:hypothetical protein NDU88_004128 [Pleurodeles waltl]|uniref:Uncharacterized protein n=1 Tax=Pleurodeles waltl TaxID=8319 RepID=A0AAV7UIF7_PLEWA|nr:hypothetical protein NDU88_004128 [Pleurodeles waltl]
MRRRCVFGPADAVLLRIVLCVYLGTRALGAWPSQQTWRARALKALRHAQRKRTPRGETGEFNAPRALSGDEEDTGAGCARGRPRRPMLADWCHVDRAPRSGREAATMPRRIRLAGMGSRAGASVAPARAGQPACGVVVDPPPRTLRSEKGGVGAPCGVPCAGNCGRS